MVGERFIYHFLQALWYPLLIDIKYLEMKLSKDGAGGNLLSYDKSLCVSFAPLGLLGAGDLSRRERF